MKIAKVSRSEVHVSGAKRGKIYVSKLRLDWILLLIGLESGARFFNQSQSEVKQNQSKHKLLLTLNPPYRKRWRLLHLPIILSTEKPKNTHKNVKKRLKTSNLAYTMLLAQGQIYTKNITFHLPTGCVTCRIKKQC